NSSLHQNSSAFFPTFSLILKLLSGIYVITITIAFDYLVYTIKVFHPNLRFLLFSFPWSYLGLFLFSFSKDLWEITFPYNRMTSRVFDYLLLICLLSICLNLFVFVLERTIALVYVKTYEYWSSPVISIILFIAQYALGALLLPFVHPIIIGLLVFSSVVASGIILWRLRSKSRFDHDRHLYTSHGVISTRYQSVENLKATRFLSRLFIYLIPAEPLIPILYAFIYVAFSKPQRAPYFDLLHVVIALHLSIALGIVIRWNNSYSVCLRRIFRMGTSKNGSLQSVTGRNLNVSQSLHSSTYFTMLEQAW
ncbi:hypothetical protein PMAYCL1PPCAC_20867, partial [Pristionchus mayeri]